MAAGPMLMLLAVGQLRPDLFEVRYIAGVVPVIVLHAGRALTSLAPSRIAMRIGAAALVLLLLAGLTDQQFNGTEPSPLRLPRSVAQRRGRGWGRATRSCTPRSTSTR